MPGVYRIFPTKALYLIARLIVGHSQGGLIIQYYLTEQIKQQSEGRLPKIRQAIFFATPNLGSSTLSWLRPLLGYLPFVTHQERTLRVLNKEIYFLQKDVLKYIVATNYKGRQSFPIPIHCFYGNNDGIVTEPSAAGHFLNIDGLTGKHDTLKQPKDHGDERYWRFTELLTNPAGHHHIFEVDDYEVSIEVEPLGGIKTIPVKHGKTAREVETDNKASLKRTVRFSKRNICHDLFDIRYTTRQDGFIDPSRSHENQAPLAQQSLYLDFGNHVTFQFRPEQEKPYWLNLGLLKAFDDGNRNVHFHFNGTSNIKKYGCTLDLRKYVGADYRFSEKPRLYFDPHEPPDHKECDKRIWENPEECKEHDSKGIWIWQLNNISTGIVHIEWDFEKGYPKSPVGIN